MCFGPVVQKETRKIKELEEKLDEQIERNRILEERIVLLEEVQNQIQTELFSDSADAK